MLIKVLWVLCVSLPARRLHFHINARLFDMMQCVSSRLFRSSWSVSPICVSHTAEELGILASCPCPSPLRPATLCPSLACGLLCNAGLLHTTLHSSENRGPFPMRRLVFSLAKNELELHWLQQKGTSRDFKSSLPWQRTFVVLAEPIG